MVGRGIAVVLVEPREPGNIGAAARAMANMGLSRLILVRPSWALEPLGLEWRMAIGGRDVLERAEVRETLGEALEGFNMVVGTTRRGGSIRSERVELREAAAELVALAESAPVAVLFGREDRGLTNREIERCQRIVTIPAALGRESLNLAQAVLLVAYELFSAGRERGSGASAPERKLAPHGSLEGMYGHMERALLRIGYLHEENPARMMRQFRRILSRAGLSEREVRALRGIFHQVEWFADTAGAGEDDGEG